MRLFEQYYEELYCYIRRYTTPSEAEDISQQVFLDLALRRGKSSTAILKVVAEEPIFSK